MMPVSPTAIAFHGCSAIPTVAHVLTKHGKAVLQNVLTVSASTLHEIDFHLERRMTDRQN